MISWSMIDEDAHEHTQHNTHIANAGRMGGVVGGGSLWRGLVESFLLFFLLRRERGRGMK